MRATATIQAWASTRTSPISTAPTACASCRPPAMKRPYVLDGLMRHGTGLAHRHALHRHGRRIGPCVHPLRHAGLPVLPAAARFPGSQVRSHLTLRATYGKDLQPLYRPTHPHGGCHPPTLARGAAPGRVADRRALSCRRRCCKRLAAFQRQNQLEPRPPGAWSHRAVHCSCWTGWNRRSCGSAARRG